MQFYFRINQIDLSQLRISAIIIDYIDKENGHKCITIWAIIINGALFEK